MEDKKYKLTAKTLGDVFADKTISTDTLELVAYILKEEKDPGTNDRHYSKVAHAYRDKSGEPCQGVWNPPLPIKECDMDLFHPPGKYLIKIVNRYNKSRSYGSVVFYNKGENYLAMVGDEEIPSAVDKKTNSIDVKLTVIEKKIEEHEYTIKKLLEITENIQQYLKKLTSHTVKPDC